MTTGTDMTITRPDHAEDCQCQDCRDFWEMTPPELPATELRILDGIGWVTTLDGRMESALPSQYVAEIERLRSALTAAQIERDEALTNRHDDLIDLRRSLTASEKRVAELIARYEPPGQITPTVEEMATWRGGDPAGAVRSFRCRINCGPHEAVDAFRAMEKANG